LGGLLSAATNSATNKQKSAKQMIVSHHGPNGIGNKMNRRMSHHEGRLPPFFGGDGSMSPIPVHIPIMGYLQF
jgi:hypothetical protein